MKIESADMIQDIYSLTPLQEGMLYHSIISNSGDYVLQKYINLPFKLNKDIFRQSAELLLTRYDVLRTVVIYEKVKEPKQVVLKSQKPEICLFDFSSYSGEELEKAEMKMLRDDISRGFNLQRDSLVRFAYCEMPGTGSKLLLTVHHIIIDGWCMQIVIDKLQEYYSMLANGMPYSEAQRAVALERNGKNEYKAYVSWIKRKDTQNAMNYWSDLAAQCETVSSIEPFGIINDDIEQTNSSNILGTFLESKLTSELKNLARESLVTFNSILECVFGLLISMYTNNKSSVFGKVVSGREAPIKNIEQIVGLFINTIPVVADFSNDASLRNTIKALYKQSVESLQYDFCSLADIQSHSVQGKDLIKILYVFENFSDDQTAEQNNNDTDDSQRIKFEYIRSQTNYDINFSAGFVDDRLKIDISYSNRYSKNEIQLMLDKIVRICEIMAECPDIPLSSISFVTDKEKSIVLNDFNNTFVDYDKNKTIVELFEEQVSKTPENIAVVFEDKCLTYDELNRKANSLAFVLRKMGVQPNDFVAIIADRSLEMICGVYGIVKSGAAYVPIEPTYPKERIQYMLGDCKPKAFLKYTAENIDLPNEFDVIDLNLESDIWKGNSENPALVNKPGDAAYCIYTSGTSGEPKGVIIENHSVVNHLNVTRNKFYAKNGNAATPLFTSFAFDFVVPAIFGTLLFGDTLAVTNDVQSLALYAENNPLAVLKITPSYFNSSYDCFNNHKGKVSTIVLGGETLTAETIGHVRQVFGDDIRIFNEYGPTETTVFTSTAEIHSSDTIVTIGKPVENSRIYMFNGEKLCGIGEPGELCIVGEGVARCYLNRPDLTAEKFIKNPFGSGKMYRSGDLAKWLPDGNIEFLGRIDEQVKIRGFRIELGEIESRIREIEHIKDCAVIARNDSTGDKAICAYYVSNSEISVSEIRDKLVQVLPYYMIPAYMMRIENIPVTKNGKLDKNALPSIDAAASREYAAPETETEKIICSIFEEILNAERVGVYDDFFELG